MTTAFDKVLREYATTEAGLTLAAGQWGQAQDTGRAKLMRRDGVTSDWIETASRLAGQTSVTGAALIGSAGITGIIPNGGSSGAAATLANMLTGIRDSVVLKAPYTAAGNTIQPTTASYVPLILKGFAAQAVDLFQVQDSSANILSGYDSAGNLYVTRAAIGSNVGLTVQNTNNTDPASGATILLAVGGSAAGDPYIRYNVNGSQDWSSGIDTSASGMPFKFSKASSLGISDFFVLDPANTHAQLINSTNNDLSFQIYNSNGSTGNNAYIDIVSLSASSSRVFVRMSGASHSWAHGLNGLGGADSYCISLGGNLGFGDAVIINTSLNVNIPNTFSVTGVATFTVAPAISSATANTAAAFDASKKLISVTNTGTGSNVLSVSPTLTGTLTAGVITATGDLTISRSNVGGNDLIEIENTDNSNAASGAKFFAKVGGSSAGDPAVMFQISGGVSVILGVDNSVSGDPFKISYSSSLGTNDALTIDSSLLATFLGNVIVGTSVTSGQANMGVAGNVGFGDGSGTAFTSLANGTGASLFKIPFKYWTGSAWETRYLAGISS